jgi:hypothetical protein
MLFKSTNNKEISEVRKFCTSFGQSTSFEQLTPHIRQAEQDFITPFLSQAQYDVIEPLYQAGATGLDLQLILKVQAALAYFTAYLFSKTNGATLVDMGNMENTPQNSAPSRQWVLRDSQESFLSTAYTNLDAMLSFLEVNQDTFTEWKESDSFSITHNCFINSTAEMQSVININRSTQVFLALKPYIKHTQLKYIETVLGTDLYEELITGIESGEAPTGDALKLIKYIREALGYLVMVEALPALNIQLTNLGVRVLSISDGITQNMVADQDARTTFSNKMYEMGNTYMARLKDFLERNASLYPLYVSLASQQETQEYKVITSDCNRVISF